MEISYKEHTKDMEEFSPYIDLLEDAQEHETVVKELYNLSNVEYLSDEFQQAYYKEIRAQLTWFRENTVIEKTEPREVVKKVEGHTFLKYNDDY